MNTCLSPWIYNAALMILLGLDVEVKPLPDERLDSLVEDLEKELIYVGAYFPMRFVWGRKPD